MGQWYQRRYMGEHTRQRQQQRQIILNLNLIYKYSNTSPIFRQRRSRPHPTNILQGEQQKPWSSPSSPSLPSWRLHSQQPCLRRQSSSPILTIRQPASSMMLWLRSRPLAESSHTNTDLSSTHPSPRSLATDTNICLGGLLRRHQQRL